MIESTVDKNIGEINIELSNIKEWLPSRRGYTNKTM